MILPAVCHLVSILSLYFMLVGVVFSAFPGTLAAVFILASTAACVLYLSLPGRGWAVLCTAAVLAPAALLRSVIPAACLLPAAVYVLFLIWDDRLSTEPWPFRSHMVWTIPFEAVGFLIGAERAGDGYFVMISAMTAFASGVIYLRACRLGRADLRSRALDIGMVFLIPASAWIAALLARGLGLLFPWLFRTLLLPFSMLLGLLVGLLQGIMSTPPPEDPVPTTAPTEPPAFEEVIDATSPITDQPLAEGAFPVQILYGILAFLAIALVLMVGYKLYKALHSGTRLQNEKQEAGEITRFDPEQDSPVRREQNRKKIRKVYTRYIRLLAEAGYHHSRKDTSRDIYQINSAFSVSDSARTMREIYIRARYDSDQPVSAQDVRDAKKQYAQLKSELRAGRG